MTNTSNSPNSCDQRDTITVPPRPDRILNQNETHRQNALPTDSLRVSKGYETDHDDQQGASELGHIQPGLIKHESLNVHSREPLLQNPLVNSEDMRVRHREYDIAGPSRARQSIKRSDQPSNGEVTLLLDPPLDYGTVTSPILDPTLPDPNLEISMTAKGKEKEGKYSNGRDNINTEYPASTSVADLGGIDPTLPSANPEAGVTTKGKEKESRYSNERDHNNTESHASTSVASLGDIDQSVPSVYPSGTSVRDKVRARRHSDWGYDTEYPFSMSEAVYKVLIFAKNSNAATNKFDKTRIATSEANINQLKAAKTQENTLDETHYDNKPVSRPTSLHMETKTNINARASLLRHLPEPPLDLQRPIPIE